MKKNLILLLLCSASASVFAGDTPFEHTSYNYWGEFANMLITLAFVLILIFFTVWMLKKLMRSRVHTLNRVNGIKILERRPLNPKSSLYLIDILGKGVVIAESPAGIHVVTEFADSVKIDELLELKKENSATPSFKESFAKKLRTIVTKNAG